jgi:hypothetical protein
VWPVLHTGAVSQRRATTYLVVLGFLAAGSCARGVGMASRAYICVQGEVLCLQSAVRSVCVRAVCICVVLCHRLCNIAVLHITNTCSAQCLR